MLDHVAETVLPDSGLQGLTGKQSRFALLVFQGATAADAYRQVYDTDTSDNATYQQASVLLANPKVAARLKELREATDRPATLAPLLSREWITNGIMGIAVSADKDSTRLAAYIALGKVAGIDLFRDIKVTETIERTPEDVERELRARLQDMARTIDGTASERKDPAPLPASKASRQRKPRT